MGQPRKFCLGRKRAHFFGLAFPPSFASCSLLLPRRTGPPRVVRLNVLVVYRYLGSLLRSTRRRRLLLLFQCLAFLALPLLTDFWDIFAFAL